MKRTTLGLLFFAAVMCGWVKPSPAAHRAVMLVTYSYDHQNNTIRIHVSDLGDTLNPTGELIVVSEDVLRRSSARKPESLHFAGSGKDGACDSTFGACDKYLPPRVARDTWHARNHSVGAKRIFLSFRNDHAKAIGPEPKVNRDPPQLVVDGDGTGYGGVVPHIRRPGRP